jgi:hypothetical protein
MHGRYGLRDLDIAAGDLSVPDEEAPSASDIDAAFKNAPFAELAEIADRLARSRDRLDAIVASFIEKLGYGKGAALTELPRLVRRAGDAIQQRMAVHPQRPAETLALSGETDEGAAGTVPIRPRCPAATTSRVFWTGSANTTPWRSRPALCPSSCNARAGWWDWTSWKSWPTCRRKACQKFKTLPGRPARRSPAGAVRARGLAHSSTEIFG